MTPQGDQMTPQDSFLKCTSQVKTTVVSRSHQRSHRNL